LSLGSSSISAGRFSQLQSSKTHYLSNSNPLHAMKRSKDAKHSIEMFSRREKTDGNISERFPKFFGNISRKFFENKNNHPKFLTLSESFSEKLKIFSHGRRPEKLDVSNPPEIF
jgi:hypothetical protein